MKNFKIIILGFMLFAFFTNSSFTQGKSKVICVINKADWCPACVQHGERAMAAFMEANTDGAIQFIANDVTNDETKKKSSENLQELGLEKVMAEHKYTGVAYFFNAESGELISQISVSKTNEELAGAVKSAKQSAIK